MPSKIPTHRPPRANLPDGRPSAAARGYGANWRRLRLAKLARDPVCEECGRAGAVDVDHQDGNVRNCSWANLRSLCHPCHSAKTCRENGGFGR